MTALWLSILVSLGMQAPVLSETTELPAPKPFHITSLNQCYDTLFDQASARAGAELMLQPTTVHGGRIENILRFKPDLVLANRFNDPLLINALRAQSVRVETLPEPDSLAEVSGLLQQLEQLTGSHLSFNADQLPQLFAGQRVLMLQANHYSLAADTLWDELVTALGGTNVAPGTGLVTVLPEQVLRLDPDLIVVLRHSGFALAARNLLHGALSPLLSTRAIEVDADLVGCMAQRLDALILHLSERVSVSDAQGAPR